MCYSCSKYVVFRCFLTFILQFYSDLLYTVSTFICSTFASTILSVCCLIARPGIFPYNTGILIFRCSPSRFLNSFVSSTSNFSCFNSKEKKSTVNLSIAYYNWKTWILIDNTPFCSFNHSFISLVVLPIYKRLFTSIFE